MKKMNFLAAFAIMMAMGNMNASAAVNNAKHGDYRVSERGIVIAHNDGHNHGVVVNNGRGMSSRERQMMEDRRRAEEARRLEEARRREAERRRMERRYEAGRVADNVVAGMAAGTAVAAFISALVH